MPLLSRRQVLADRSWMERTEQLSQWETRLDHSSRSTLSWSIIWCSRMPKSSTELDTAVTTVGCRNSPHDFNIWFMEAQLWLVVFDHGAVLHEPELRSFHAKVDRLRFGKLCELCHRCGSAFRCVQRHSIRPETQHTCLVIRNTGHEYVLLKEFSLNNYNIN